MNQEIQPLFEVDAMKVAVGSTPDPEVAALPKRRRFSAAYKHRIVREGNALGGASLSKLVQHGNAVVHRAPPGADQ